MITKVLSEHGVEYSENNPCNGWISTETNAKCGDVRFFNHKMYIVEYLTPYYKKWFKPQTYQVHWKEYELNNRYRVQDVEERLEKRIDEVANLFTLPNPSYAKFKDEIIDFISTLVIDVAQLKKQVDKPSPWVSTKDLDTVTNDLKKVQRQLDYHINEQFSAKAAVKPDLPAYGFLGSDGTTDGTLS